MLYLNFLPFFEFVIGHITLYTPSSKCQKPTKKHIDSTNFFHLYLHPSFIKNPSLIKKRIPNAKLHNNLESQNLETKKFQESHIKILSCNTSQGKHMLKSLIITRLYFCPFLDKRRIFFCFYTPISYNPPTTTSLALSIMDESIEARYICVVVTESCPSASEMTLTGTFFDLAMVAQVWRVT